ISLQSSEISDGQEERKALLFLILMKESRKIRSKKQYPSHIRENKNIKSHVNQKALLSGKLSLWMDPIICRRTECQHHLGLTMDQLGKSRQLLSAETRKANL
ncbi:hypothetical protein DBR06_SOUSAS510172, partial [Sousa chinensis]